MNAPLRRWTLSEEVTIVRMRRENACAKMIAKKLDRTPESVGQHVHRMMERGRQIGHRHEDAFLLERLLEAVAVIA